jgi:hypothetical protein
MQVHVSFSKKSFSSEKWNGLADILDLFRDTGTEEQWLKPQGGAANNSIPDTGAPTTTEAPAGAAAPADVTTTASGIVTSASGSVPVHAKQHAPA